MYTLSVHSSIHFLPLVWVQHGMWLPQGFVPVGHLWNTWPRRHPQLWFHSFCHYPEIVAMAGARSIDQLFKWQLCFHPELSFYQNRPVECPHHCRCPFQSPGPLSPQSWARPQDTQIPSLGAAAHPRPSVQMFPNLEVLIFIPAASHLAAKGLLDAGRCAECTFLLNSSCLSRTNCC